MISQQLIKVTLTHLGAILCWKGLLANGNRDSRNHSPIFRVPVHHLGYRHFITLRGFPQIQSCVNGIFVSHQNRLKRILVMEY